MEASINLPNELMREIVAFALSKEPYEIGNNAAWNMPRRNAFVSYVCQYSNPPTPIGDILPFPLGTEDNDDVNSSTPEKEVGFYATAKSLRLVNHAFDEIVTPVLYEEMNLLLHTMDVAKLTTIVERGILPYAHHIRSLYIYADPKFKALSGELEEYSIKVLRSCVKLTSLGLYFQVSDLREYGEWAEFRQAVVTLVEEGELSSLGFYSQYVMTNNILLEYHLLLDGLINALSISDRARTRIKHLDFAVFLIPAEVHNKIRSNFPNLESLTMRMSFRGAPGGYGDPGGRGRWFQLNSLTRLQFHSSEGAYAPHIPQIVALFPALRELLISRCTAPIGNPTPSHAEGWHLQPDALYQTHKPLDWFHIELMANWQIRALGLIPTKTLILTCINPADFLNEVNKDRNLFPGMKILRLQKHFSGEIQGDMMAFEEFAGTREVKIIRDAIPLQ
ncbi:hypothetical protein CPB86DRAFT_787260 [Serendipita vermifera]|nr:hypothetical protein CPB86DRAFT_787260 [Serendipita vermifera]